MECSILCLHGVVEAEFARGKFGCDKNVCSLYYGSPVLDSQQRCPRTTRVMFRYVYYTVLCHIYIYVYTYISAHEQHEQV